MKRCSLGKCKLKWQYDITPYLSEWPSSKQQKITNSGTDVEKREPLCTVGGMVNGTATRGNRKGSSRIVKTELSYDPAILLLGIYPKEIKPLN